MQPNPLDFQDISPFCRFAGRIEIPADTPMPTRAAYDHRLFFALDDHAVIKLNGMPVHLRQGCCALLLSGAPYSIRAEKNSAAFLVVNFDFFPNESRQQRCVPLPMTAPHLFNPARQVEHIAFADGLFAEGSVLLEGMYLLTPWLEALASEYERAELLHIQQTRALLTLCLNHIVRTLRQPMPARSTQNHQEILDFIATHYCEPLTNQEIAARFHYHPNYVNHIVQQRTGISLHRYLLRLRIHRATELLLSGSESVASIAQMTGFADANYFTQYFKRCVGCSPSAFRGDHSRWDG